MRRTRATVYLPTFRQDGHNHYEAPPETTEVEINVVEETESMTGGFDEYTQTVEKIHPSSIPVLIEVYRMHLNRVAAKP